MRAMRSFGIRLPAVRLPSARIPASRRDPGRVRAALARDLIWLLPALILVVVYVNPHGHLSANRVLAYVAALAIVILAARRPGHSLVLLIVLLPFQGLLLSKLWAITGSATVAKDLGAWKEVLALGVVVAGARHWLRVRPRADAFDKLALAFVVISLLYVVLQPELVPGASASFTIRVFGFRETAGFVLLALGARHAPFPPRFSRILGGAVILTAVLLALIGIYEEVSPDAWNRFVVATMEYTRYQVSVLGTTPDNMWNVLTYTQIGGTQVVRIGSALLSPGTLGFVLLFAFAVGLERTLEGARAATALVPTTLIVVALLLTETRSAIIGALVVAALAFRPSAGRRRSSRIQAAIVLAIVALVAIPAAASSGFLSRFALLTNSGDTSTQGHERGFFDGVDTVASNPLGLGIGTGAGTGQRFDVEGTTIPENNYLEVGDELGVAGMLVFAALTVSLFLALRRAALARPDPLVIAAWSAAGGLAVGAWFLQTWADFSVAWTFWGVAGAALGIATRRPLARAGPGGARSAGPPAGGRSPREAPPVPEPAVPAAVGG